MLVRTALLLLALVLPVPALRAAQVRSPEQHLGHPLAKDSYLPDWKTVSSYFEQLDQASPRVLTETIGTSTKGRPFVLSTISSEANLARLDEVRAYARRLSDPRGA